MYLLGLPASPVGSGITQSRYSCIFIKFRAKLSVVPPNGQTDLCVLFKSFPNKKRTVFMNSFYKTFHSSIINVSVDLADQKRLPFPGWSGRGQRVESKMNRKTN